MKYNLAILGGGPAGYTAAFEAAKAGLTVVMFEKNLLGGTCLNCGCVPTKYLAHTSKLYSMIQNSENYGITVDNYKIDYKKTIQTKQKIIHQLRNGLQTFIKQNKIDVVYKEAKLLDSRNILCDEKIYQADYILIATGSTPIEPIIKGTQNSTEILELERIPNSINIIGGGVIAVEFAKIFRALGSDVSIYIRGDRLLRKWDKDIAIGLTQSMKKQGIKIITNCSFEQYDFNNAKITLSAIGRKANLQNLTKHLFEIGASGGIIIDEYGRTKSQNIYAAGDVVNNSSMLAHTAMEQAKRAVLHIIGKQVPKKSKIIQCIYTNPEIASIGITENEAKSKNLNAICVKQTMYSNARTLISTSERSFIKLIADTDSGKLLGAQLMCERATDIISELALAINNEMTVEMLLQSTRPHPSYVEAVTEALLQLKEKLES